MTELSDFAASVEPIKLRDPLGTCARRLQRHRSSANTCDPNLCLDIQKIGSVRKWRDWQEGIDRISG